MTRPVHVRFWGVEDFLHGVPRDCHRNANNTVPIQEALFSRRPCTCPYHWAGPQSRSQRLDLIIQLSSNSFNLVMPARPEEARAQDRPYEQKGLLGLDGNWLSKRARQNEAGSTAVASPV